MDAEKVESVSSLVSAMEAKKEKTKIDIACLNKKKDQLITDAAALEEQARSKRREAAEIDKQIKSVVCGDTGDFTKDVLLPLVEELSRRSGKRVYIAGVVRGGYRRLIVMSDGRGKTSDLQDRVGLVLEEDYSGEHLTLRYETGECTDRYEPGTVGFINGLNNITAPLPDSVEEILALFRTRPAVNLSEKEEKSDGTEG